MKHSFSKLPLPIHFEPEKVDQVWQVPYHQRASEAREWASRHELKPAAQDQVKVALLLIDVQNTFCQPGFELYVGGKTGKGAVEDNVRLCRFIYENIPVVSRIFATMDTHHAVQIFHPCFWVDDKGNHPIPAQTIISIDDVLSGRWKINPDVVGNFPKRDEKSLQNYIFHYIKTLGKTEKFPLMVWPYHAMLGGIGHALVSSVEEAVFFHSIARSSQTIFNMKGENPLTENYSVLAPEVQVDEKGDQLARKDLALIDRLLEHDAIIIAGQAKSHCVAWTIEDLLSEIQARNPELTRKVYLLEDCTSPVVVPGVIDFSEPANQAYQRFAAAGMHLVKTNLPISRWPGIFTK